MVRMCTYNIIHICGWGDVSIHIQRTCIYVCILIQACCVVLHGPNYVPHTLSPLTPPPSTNLTTRPPPAMAADGEEGTEEEEEDYGDEDDYGGSDDDDTSWKVKEGRKPLLACVRAACDGWLL